MIRNAYRLAAVAAGLAAVLVATALCAAPDGALGHPARQGAVLLAGPPQGPIGLTLLLDIAGVAADPGHDRLRFGALIGWSTGFASAGIAALAIGDAVTGRHELKGRSVFRTICAHIRLGPSLMSTPDGNAGVGATLTVMF